MPLPPLWTSLSRFMASFVALIQRYHPLFRRNLLLSHHHHLIIVTIIMISSLSTASYEHPMLPRAKKQQIHF
jgi:hypothetical protein